MRSVRLELFAQIRRDARVEGLSIRALAVRHGVQLRVRLAGFGARGCPRSRKPTPSRS